MKPLKAILLGTTLAAAFVSIAAQADNQPSGYMVKDLLEVCMEGANDARGGAADEMAYYQYIKGVTDTVVTLKMDKGLCLPPADGARSGVLSRAFVTWVYEDFERRNLPAARGILQTLVDHFACTN